jgi:hypothetical protein
LSLLVVASAGLGCCGAATTVYIVDCEYCAFLASFCQSGQTIAATLDCSRSSFYKRMHNLTMLSWLASIHGVMIVILS